MLCDVICHVRNGDFELPRTHVMKNVKISKLVKNKVSFNFWISRLC